MRKVTSRMLLFSWVTVEPDVFYTALLPITRKAQGTPILPKVADLITELLCLPEA